MKEIPLSKGYVALVDDEDFERANQYKWTAAEAGKTCYAWRSTYYRLGPRRKVYLHRFILNAPDGVEVDHRDGDGLHCWHDNLRIATHAQNQQYQGLPSNNTSGYKGVRWDKARLKWRVQITVNGRELFVGRFDDLETAARVYDAKAIELHGEFAWTNFSS